MNFDTRDWESMKAMMEECKSNPSKYQMPFFGVNEDDEAVKVEVYEDRIVLYTTQKNDWIRQNIYWNDGTVEELYDGSLLRAKQEDNGVFCPCCGQYVPISKRK